MEPSGPDACLLFAAELTYPWVLALWASFWSPLQRFFGVSGANSVAQGTNLVAFLALQGFFCRFTLIAQAWAGRSFHHYSGHEARYTKWYQSGLDLYHEPGIP